MKQDLEKEMSLLDGATATLSGDKLTIKGKKGEITRRVPTQLHLKIDGDKLSLSSKKATRREKKLLFTYAAHIKNMVKGATQGFVYKLKICSGHFPMKVACKGSTFSVTNFLGEKIPRKMPVPTGAKITVAGSDITVEASDIEVAGRTASNIEQLTRICDKDRRIFQDGIYITDKAGRKV